MKLQEQIAEGFSNLAASGEEQAAAFRAFERLGIPTTREEEWKYTSLKSVTDKAFSRDAAPTEAVGAFLEKSGLMQLPARRMVFSNGRFCPQYSNLSFASKGVLITSLVEARNTHKEIIEKHYGHYAKAGEQSLVAMNTALPGDGAFIHIEDGQGDEMPVLIIHIADASEADVLQQPRNLVVLGKNASLQLIEAYHCTGGKASFTNAVTEVYVSEGAMLDYDKVQQGARGNYHNHFTQLFQEAESNVNQVTITLGGALLRNNLHFYLNGAHCNSLLYGLYLGADKDHIDNHSRVDHAKPNCSSNELYKGILNDQSTAVFNGKIIVHEGAQKTSAYQRNQNILLSDEATVNTKPQLEIFADDVKCTHGATTGQLQEEPLFYLRSRGIPAPEARRMLLNAFAADVTSHIRSRDLAGLLEKEISGRL